MNVTFNMVLFGTTYEVFPVNAGEIESELIDDETGAYFHRTKTKKLKFKNRKGSTYTLLKKMFNQSSCNEGTMVIEFCDKQYLFYFSKFDMTLNEDKCYIELDLNVNDDYRCLYEGWETKHNLIQWSTTTARLSNFVEYDIVANIFGTGSFPAADGWELLANLPLTQGGTNNVDVFARQVLTYFCLNGTTPQPPNNTWNLYQDNCPIQITYTKGLGDIFQVDHESDIPPDHIKIPVDAGGPTMFAHSDIFQENTYDFADIDFVNGSRLSNVLTGLLTESCGYTIKSDFFQINPDNVSSINYVTGETSRVTNILLFDASDIKDPIAATPATKRDISLKDLMTDLHNAFRVKWRIINGNVLEIEHESFFTSTVGLDFSEDAGYRVISLERGLTNNRIKFSSFYNRGIDAKGVDILYSGSCTNEDTKEISVKFTSDVIRLKDDSINDGLVMIACQTEEISTNLYYIEPDEGAISQQVLPNTALGWANLHKDFHKHERDLDTVNINNEDISSLSVKKSRKQTISVSNPCLNIPEDELVTTSYGDGIIQKMTTPLLNCRSKIELLI